MKCEDALELISGKLDGMLSPEEERLLQEHLDGCAECRAAYEAMAGMDDTLSCLSLEPPKELQKNVMRQIRRETRRKKYSWVPAAAVAAAAALALLVSGTKLAGLPGTGGKASASVRRMLDGRSVREEQKRAQSLADERKLPVLALHGAAPAELEQAEFELLSDGARVYALTDDQLRTLADARGARIAQPAGGAAGQGGLLLLLP